MQIAIEEHMGLVGKVANKYRNRGTDFAELMQVGCLGLLRAAEDWDDKLGKWSTYATWWIRQHITRFVMGNKSVAVPEYLISPLSLYKRLQNEGVDDIRAEMNRLAAIKGDEPIDDKVWSYVVSANMATKIVSMDAPSEKNDRVSLGTTIVDCRESTEVDAPETVANLLKFLNDRERQVITLRFNLDGNGGHNLDEIGLIMNRSKQRIQQIETAALAKMQRAGQNFMMVG